MTALGGPPELLAAVRKAGRRARYRSYWVGAWMLKHGWDGLTNFYRECARDGDDPLILFWWWGDDISEASIQNGVLDRHQGVRKDRRQALAAALKIGALAAERQLTPTVCLEPEFNKGGIEKGSVVFDSYFSITAGAIREACPGARILFSPGSWGDLKALADRYREAVEECDGVALQALAGLGRMNSSLYQNEVPDLVRNLAAFRSAGGRCGSMPAILSDVGFSSYGNVPANAPHPFAGGTGTAGEAAQLQAAKALTIALPAMNVEAAIYRSLDDDPGFATTNYFGHAERWWGLRRADGSMKPAFDALLQAASPAPGIRDAEALRSELERCRTDYGNLRERSNTARDLLA